MNNNIDDLVKFLNPLLSNLSDGEMSKLNKKVGMDLRRNQQQHISQQQNPDGSAYAPRRLREGKRIRKKMFSKLKANRFLRNFSNANSVTVGFLSNVNRIATIHHFGLRDRIERNKPFTTTYEKRELLGFSDSDLKMIEQSVIKHLNVLDK